jgi:hypothetical protein
MASTTAADSSKKLGIKPGMTAAGIAAPPAISKALGLGKGSKPGDKPDVIVAFVSAIADVAAHASEAIAVYQRGAALWFAYPKKTGTIKTDISRDAGWEPVTQAGLLPVTLVSLDDTWSALRFRYRDEIKKLTRKNA